MGAPAEAAQFWPDGCAVSGRTVVLRFPTCVQTHVTMYLLWFVTARETSRWCAESDTVESAMSHNGGVYDREASETRCGMEEGTHSQPILCDPSKRHGAAVHWGI